MLYVASNQKSPVGKRNKRRAERALRLQKGTLPLDVPSVIEVHDPHPITSALCISVAQHGDSRRPRHHRVGRLVPCEVWVLGWYASSRSLKFGAM